MIFTFLLNKIFQYEPGIYKNIENQTIYCPQTNEELQNTVDIWCKDRQKGLEEFGHISSWNTSKITNMSHLFRCECKVNGIKHDLYCEDSGENVGWWLSHECDCEYTRDNIKRSVSYCGKKYFNDDINKWDVSNVQFIHYMFSRCINFNQPLDKWDLSSLATDRWYHPASLMFDKCYKFNQDLSNWKLPSHRQNDLYDVLDLKDTRVSKAKAPKSEPYDNNNNNETSNNRKRKRSD